MGEIIGGVHGKNRLKGNALLVYKVFGGRDGRATATDILDDVGPDSTFALAYACQHAEACRQTGSNIGKSYKIGFILAVFSHPHLWYS